MRKRDPVPKPRGKKTATAPKTEKDKPPSSIQVRGARVHNLKNLDVDLPRDCLVVLTGVSGSGKSSLVNDILWEVLNRDINQGTGHPGEYAKILGLEHIDKHFREAL